MGKNIKFVLEKAHFQRGFEFFIKKNVEGAS